MAGESVDRVKEKKRKKKGLVGAEACLRPGRR
jgi:hypothetical protein